MSKLSANARNKSNQESSREQACCGPTKHALANARKLVRAALRDYPELNSHGIRHTPEQGTPLAEWLREVALCAMWLRAQRLTRGVTHKSPGSYRLKHVVEAWAGCYVPNGALIAAAVGLGIKTLPRGHSVDVGISQI